MRRGTLLLFSGLTSEVVYLAAVVRLPWWRYGGRLRSWAHLLGDDFEGLGICLAGIALLVAAYVWGWYVIHQGEVKEWIVWGFVGLFAVTLFWLMPITSDLFSYLTQAHLLTDLGGNPLRDAPLDYSDPLVLAYPDLYATRPTAYGPAWLLVSAPGTLGPHDVAGGLFYLKALASVAYLGCAWLLRQILRQLRPAAAVEGVYLFAWNPLVVLAAVGDGHNDIVMMALVLLAAWLLLRERYALAFGILALSVWIKYVSLIFVPLVSLYAWRRLGGESIRRRWGPLARGAVVAMSVSILVFTPFWNLAGIGGIVGRLFQPANWHGGTTPLAAWVLAGGVLLFTAVFVFLAWQIVRGEGSFQQLANTSFLASLLAFLLGASRSQPWHLIWPAAMAGLSDYRWAWPAVVAVSAVMLVAQIWVEWGAPGASIFW